ncbi:MAG: RidA family protein [Gammaproteobacteria bacterium]|nr:MAG: RidA family protein [Gammaproteobacteria bacterium]
MTKSVLHTDKAPAAIGTYSQAVAVGDLMFISGQIPLDPVTMEMVSDDFAEQTHRVFKNLAAICEAAGHSLNQLVKVNIYLTDLTNFATVNEIMAQYFEAPYPARAAVEVSALPKGAQIEIEGVLSLK